LQEHTIEFSREIFQIVEILKSEKEKNRIKKLMSKSLQESDSPFFRGIAYFYLNGIRINDVLGLDTIHKLLITGQMLSASKITNCGSYLKIIEKSIYKNIFLYINAFDFNVDYDRINNIVNKLDSKIIIVYNKESNVKNLSSNFNIQKFNEYFIANNY